MTDCCVTGTVEGRALPSTVVTGRGFAPRRVQLCIKFYGSMKKFNEFSRKRKKKKKKKSLHTNHSCIKTKVVIKFPKKKKKKNFRLKIGLALEGLHATIKMYLTSDTQCDYYTLIPT